MISLISILLMRRIIFIYANIICCSKYQLFVVKGQAQPCLPNGLNETISPSKLPLTLEVEAGVTSIKGISLEMGTFGFFRFCYYAVIQEKVCDVIGHLANFA